MNLKEKFEDLLKRHNLPTRAIVSHYTKDQLKDMTLKDIDHVFRREQAKMEIIHTKLRSMKSDLSKKAADAYKEDSQISTDLVNLQYVPQTRTVEKKREALRERRKTIAERIRNAKNDVMEQGTYLSKKLDEIGKQLEVIRQVYMEKYGMKKTPKEPTKHDIAQEKSLAKEISKISITEIPKEDYRQIEQMKENRIEE